MRALIRILLAPGLRALGGLTNINLRNDTRYFLIGLRNMFGERIRGICPYEINGASAEAAARHASTEDA